MTETNPVTRDLAKELAELVIVHFRANPAFASPWMNEAQAAEYLGIKQRGIQNHRRKGTGPRWYMPAGLCRYHREDLDAYMLAAPVEPGK